MELRLARTMTGTECLTVARPTIGPANVIPKLRLLQTRTLALIVPFLCSCSVRSYPLCQTGYASAHLREALERRQLLEGADLPKHDPGCFGERRWQLEIDSTGESCWSPIPRSFGSPSCISDAFELEEQLHKATGVNQK